MWVRNVYYHMKKTLLLLGVTVFYNSLFSQALPVVKATAFKKDTVSIIKYGAKGNGEDLATTAIQGAIDALAQKGGGVVLIPSVHYPTGPIVLKSNINLHLAIGATLLYTRDYSKFPLVEGNWEGLPQMRNQSPISATRAENIAITGKGIIDGNGDAWRQVKKDKLTETQWKKLVASGGILGEDQKTWYPHASSYFAKSLKNPGVIDAKKSPAFYDSVKVFLRPNMVVFTECKRILLDGVIFQNSPAWCLHPLMCEDLTVRNVFVKNPWYAQNGDGIDVESCKNVLIENSVFDVGDDALCMKSGRDAEGRKRGMPTENVIIRGCTVYASHGGFVIGSEMSGGARNMYISNCTFIGSDIGLRFKTTRGRGGVVENIHVRDIYMKDIPAEAILFDMYYMATDPVPLAGEKRSLPQVEFKPVDESTPIFRNIDISNVYVNGAAKGIFVRGLPEMHIRDLVFRDIVIQSKKGIDIQEATGLQFKNIKIISEETDPVVSVINSEKIVFENLVTKPDAKEVLSVQGDRSKDIIRK